jgi:catechol 2,3-dioxygenase-like lactoylglutathione lyase family enzyme
MNTDGRPGTLDRVHHVAISVGDLVFTSPRAEGFGALTTHRDGTRSTYVKDPAGNSVEILAAD